MTAQLGALLRWFAMVIFVTMAGLIGLVGVFASGAAQAGTAQALEAKFQSLEVRLRQNQFNQPLVVDSSETANQVSGEIYAVVDYRFSLVSAQLNQPGVWCDVMHLHINTKYCRASSGPNGTLLKVNIGKKTPEKLIDTSRVDFKFKLLDTTPQYLNVALTAPNGPMGTSNYLIQLEAIALPGYRSFLHLTYSYTMNLPARLALQAYLGTVGRGKVGFTMTQSGVDQQAEYIGGVRGLVERNAMRYYLAIDSFLESVLVTTAKQPQTRMISWFAAVERYPRQLHEVDRLAYLEMKAAEYERQQTDFD